MSDEESDRQQFTFTWRIANFSLCDQKNEEKIISPTFTAENLEESKWNLWLYPRGVQKNYEAFISCGLKCVDLNSKNINIGFNISFIDIYKRILDYKSTKNQEIQRDDNWIFFKGLKREKIEILPGDVLTIVCRMTRSETTDNFASGCEARTNIGVDRISFQWSVKYPQTETWTESKKLPIPEESPIKIILTSPDDNVLISIHRNSEQSLPTRFISCKISLLDLNGGEQCSKSSSHLLESNPWEFPSFITKTLLQNNGIYLISKIFVIAFELSISNGKQLGEIEKYMYNTSLINCPENIEQVPSLHDDFRNLFNSKKHSDIKLKAGELLFPVHKSVLVARSPVFSVMFEHDMRESQTGVIDIHDIDANTLKCFLNFLYTDSIIEVDKEIAPRLLIAADKYQVLSLKEKCSALLMTVLSDENVCDILAIADMVEHKKLKSSAMDYIKIHSEDILPTSDWSLWIEKNFKLGIEVLSKLSAEFGSAKYKIS